MLGGILVIAGLAVAAGAYIGFSFYPHPEMNTTETIMIVQAETNRRVEELDPDYFAGVPKGHIEQIVARSVLGEMRQRYHTGRQMLMTAGAAVLLIGCTILLSSSNRILKSKLQYLQANRPAAPGAIPPLMRAGQDAEPGDV